MAKMGQKKALFSSFEPKKKACTVGFSDFLRKLRDFCQKKVDRPPGLLKIRQDLGVGPRNSQALTKTSVLKCPRSDFGQGWILKWAKIA